MPEHKKYVKGFNGSLDQLAKNVGIMQYNYTSSFIESLANDIAKQADADLMRGRGDLSSRLYETANELYQAKEKMDLAWKICKPYMKG